MGWEEKSQKWFQGFGPKQLKSRCIYWDGKNRQGRFEREGWAFGFVYTKFDMPVRPQVGIACWLVSLEFYFQLNSVGLRIWQGSGWGPAVAIESLIPDTEAAEGTFFPVSQQRTYLLPLSNTSACTLVWDMPVYFPRGFYFCSWSNDLSVQNYLTELLQRCLAPSPTPYCSWKIGSRSTWQW